MTAAAPKIMLMVLKRLLITAKKVNTRCAVVPTLLINVNFSYRPLFSLTVSDTNNFKNGMCFWNALLADHSQVCKEDYHTMSCRESAITQHQVEYWDTWQRTVYTQLRTRILQRFHIDMLPGRS